MKRDFLSVKFLASSTLVVLSALPQLSSGSDDFGSMIREPEQWLFNKSKEKLIEKVDQEVNTYFQEDLYPALVDKALENLGADAADHLTTLFSWAPAFSIASVLISSSGPSESQVMMQVILEALEETEREIINAVEENFQDDLESQLNAIILNLKIYNSRDEIYRNSEYQMLSELSYYAGEVKKKIEQRPSKSIDNSHLYILISSIHSEIEKQYANFLAKAVYPNETDEFLNGESEKEYKSVFKTIVDDGINFLVDSDIGSIDYWRNSYKTSFKNEVQYVGPGSSSDPANSYFYSYKMNDKPVKFRVVRGSSCTLRTNKRSFKIYDSLGNYFSGFRTSCQSSNQKVAGLIQERIPRMVDVHRNSNAGFDEYIFSGYTPVKEIFDNWWSYVSDQPRPLSEVDAYIQAGKPHSYPSLCASSDIAGTYVGTSIKGQGRPSSSSCYPCGMKSVKDGIWTTHYYCLTE